MNSTTGKALAYIREAILSGRLPAGSLLPTKNLAEEIGVSRTPVRDALRQLEAEGLATMAPRQEARVKELSIEDDKAIGELQIALEAYTAQLAALRRTEEDLKRIREHHALVVEWASRPTPEARAEEEEAAAMIRVIRAQDEADAGFHLAIMNAARNEQLKAEALRLQLIQSLSKLPWSAHALRTDLGKLSWAEYRSPSDEMVKAHEKILHAIEMQSPEGAYAAMRDHLEEGLNRRLRALKAIRDQEMQWALGHSLQSQGG